MKYQLSKGITIDIPQDELDTLMSNLDLKIDEAIELWLTDNDYKINTEQQNLNKKAEVVKIDHQTGKKVIKGKKKQTVKVSNEKKDLFAALSTFLGEYYSEKGGKCEVLRENKLISVEINNKKFKIDLIQTRT